MIHIGFTGTQLGMTAAQGQSVWELVKDRIFYAHHGDCIGADKVFDALVREARGMRGVFIHPPLNESKRAFCRADEMRDVVLPAKEYLVRNQDIVDESDIMIATPKEAQMQTRSGTWSTVRLALKSGKPIAIVMPDGAVVFDGAAWPT